MEKQPIEDMLERPYRNDWELMSEKFRGQDTKIGLATPDGVIDITGKFAYGTYPSSICLSDINYESMKLLQPIEIETGKFNRGVKWTKYGLLYRTEDLHNLGTTVRAFYFAEEHSIKSIKMRNGLIYESPFIPEIYGFANIQSQDELRVKHDFPIPSSI